MAKIRTQYICQNCGTVHARWSGRCDACGDWNTIVEETQGAGVGGAPSRSPRKGRIIALESLAGAVEDQPRLVSRIAELDRVAGGGFVNGSAILVGGDPGIGKSTLLIQTAAALARAKHRVVYVSGEEAVAQVRLRAQRLGLADAAVELMAETSVEDIVATLSAGAMPRLVVIDSIQTMWTEAIESAPGTVSQVRASAQALIRYAKATGSSLVLVGHVTKDGQIAGPRVVEHMVDAVFYFEGDAAHRFRILRAVKNRFGATDEIGVFEMTGLGLKEIPNPSELFLSDRDGSAPGTAVFGGMEGTRPVLVEVQALVAPTALGTPRRAVVGWDSNRLAMVIAVLEARCGVKLGQHDVYLAVAGGLRVQEPAADLAVAAALVSALAGVPLAAKAVFFGEISLSGAIRPVAQAGARVKEAERLGFTEAVMPEASAADAKPGGALTVAGIPHLTTLVARVAASRPRAVEGGGRRS